MCLFDNIMKEFVLVSDFEAIHSQRRPYQGATAVNWARRAGSGGRIVYGWARQVSDDWDDQSSSHTCHCDEAIPGRPINAASRSKCC